MHKPNSDSNLNTEGWKDIDWRRAERYVFKLQKRIYAASRRGDVNQCRKLQRTLRRSWSNRILAVRRVTVENQGKKTAGVDGAKSLSPKARLKLVRELKLSGKSKPTRRVWIPKPGREEKRPLGIPTSVRPRLTSRSKSYTLCQNGKRSLNPTHMALDLEGHATMRLNKLNFVYSKRRNTC